MKKTLRGKAILALSIAASDESYLGEIFKVCRALDYASDEEDAIAAVYFQVQALLGDVSYEAVCGEAALMLEEGWVP